MSAQLGFLFSFNGSDGAQPAYGGLTADANGDLFGTTAGDGPDGYGTVFEVQNTGTVAAPIYASAPTTLVSFNGSNGQGPEGGLIVDGKGDLFGTTQLGSATGSGTVFQIKNTGTVAAPVYASTPTTLVNFGGSNGSEPTAGLIADANGDLFGTTESGGSTGSGTVFELRNTGTVTAPVYASTPTTLVNFNGSNGQDPVAGLIIDANGDLFGTTTSGGTNNKGTVFEIKNIGAVAAPIYASVPTTLVSFNGYAYSVEMNINGTLYGDTFAGSFSTDALGAVTGGRVSAYSDSVWATHAERSEQRRRRAGCRYDNDGAQHRYCVSGGDRKCVQRLQLKHDEFEFVQRSAVWHSALD